MALALSSRKPPIGSAGWILSEREQAHNLIAQEVEDYGYCVRNEIDWLNEHMKDIFFKDGKINVADAFKTPGRLRGKTPRTARRMQHQQANILALANGSGVSKLRPTGLGMGRVVSGSSSLQRTPLADVFAPNAPSYNTPSKTLNPIAEKPADNNGSPAFRTLLQRVASGPLAGASPSHSVPRPRANNTENESPFQRQQINSVGNEITVKSNPVVAATRPKRSLSPVVAASVPIAKTQSVQSGSIDSGYDDLEKHKNGGRLSRGSTRSRGGSVSSSLSSVDSLPDEHEDQSAAEESQEEGEVIESDDADVHTRHDLSADEHEPSSLVPVLSSSPEIPQRLERPTVPSYTPKATNLGSLAPSESARQHDEYPSKLPPRTSSAKSPISPPVKQANGGLPISNHTQSPVQSLETRMLRLSQSPYKKAAPPREEERPVAAIRRDEDDLDRDEVDEDEEDKHDQAIKPVLRKSSLTFASLPGRDRMGKSIGGGGLGSRPSTRPSTFGRTSVTGGTAGLVRANSGGRSLGGDVDAKAGASAAVPGPGTTHLQNHNQNQNPVHYPALGITTTNASAPSPEKEQSVVRDVSKEAMKINHTKEAPLEYPHRSMLLDHHLPNPSSPLQSRPQVTIPQNQPSIARSLIQPKPRVGEASTHTSSSRSGFFFGQKKNQSQASRDIGSPRVESVLSTPILSPSKSIRSRGAANLNPAAPGVSSTAHTIAEPTTPVQPASPSRKFNDATASAKAKLFSVFKSARGIFASSVGVSAQAKLEAMNAGSPGKNGYGAGMSDALPVAPSPAVRPLGAAADTSRPEPSASNVVHYPSLPPSPTKDTRPARVSNLPAKVSSNSMKSAGTTSSVPTRTTRAMAAANERAQQEAAKRQAEEEVERAREADREIKTGKRSAAQTASTTATSAAAGRGARAPPPRTGAVSRSGTARDEDDIPSSVPSSAVKPSSNFGYKGGVKSKVGGAGAGTAASGPSAPVGKRPAPVSIKLASQRAAGQFSYQPSTATLAATLAESLGPNGNKPTAPPGPASNAPRPASSRIVRKPSATTLNQSGSSSVSSVGHSGAASAATPASSTGTARSRALEAARKKQQQLQSERDKQAERERFLAEKSHQQHQSSISQPPPPPAQHPLRERPSQAQVRVPPINPAKPAKRPLGLDEDASELSGATAASMASSNSVRSVNTSNAATAGGEAKRGPGQAPGLGQHSAAMSSQMPPSSAASGPDAKRRKTIDRDGANTAAHGDVRRSVAAPPVRQTHAMRQSQAQGATRQSHLQTQGQSQQSQQQQQHANKFSHGYLKPQTTAQMSQQMNRSSNANVSSHGNSILLSQTTSTVSATATASGHQYKTPAKTLAAARAALVAATSAAKPSPLPAHQFTPGETIDLPEIPTDSEESDSDGDSSDYSDSGPGRASKGKDKDGNFQPSWVQSPALHDILAQQQLVDPETVFGPIAPLRMDELFGPDGKRKKKGVDYAKDRTSSANWVTSGDLLTEEEKRWDRQARERLIREGGWTFQLGR